MPTEFNAVAGSEDLGLLKLTRVCPDNVGEHSLRRRDRGVVFVPGYLSRRMPRWLLFRMSEGALKKQG